MSTDYGDGPGIGATWCVYAKGEKKCLFLQAFQKYEAEEKRMFFAQVEAKLENFPCYKGSFTEHPWIECPIYLYMKQQEEIENYKQQYEPGLSISEFEHD